MQNHQVLPVEPLDLTIPEEPTVEEQVDMIDVIFDFCIWMNKQSGAVVACGLLTQGWRIETSLC